VVLFDNLIFYLIFLTKQPRPPNPERNLTDEPIDKILQWAKSDAPAEYDYFGHYHKAKKIAERIKKSIDEKGNVTVGLRGGYGSGKTTITNLHSVLHFAQKTCNGLCVSTK
jgi:hypothetical protein